MSRLFVIGLDCATPELVFGACRKDLPNLHHLAENGVFGKLKSTIPPITVPAWSCMLSSKDPGQLGLYGFKNRKSYQYDDHYISNAADVKERRVWEYLETHDLTSILIGIPQTYPPSPMKGIMISSFLTPNKSVDYTYPHAVRDEIDRIADGDYIIDVPDFRTHDKDRLLRQIYRMTERRFKVVRHYLKHKPWDFFMFVEMGIDRIQHAFWHYHDSSHPTPDAIGPYRNAIKDYYRYVDSEIGLILENLEEDVSLMVVSDHGAKRMDGAVCINEWLIRKGHLCLHKPVKQPTRLTKDMVDWRKTRVWAEGGYCARLFFNVENREPKGTIPQNEVDLFRESIIEDLKYLNIETGKKIQTKVFTPHEIYQSVKNIPPDLIVYFENLNLRATGAVGHGTICIDQNDTGPDGANHAEHGVFIFKTDPNRLAKAGFTPGQEIENLSLYDVTPTILDYYGLSVPKDMVGQSMLTRNSRNCTYHLKGQSPDQVKPYTEEEEAIILERLRKLGYI